jgi:hypothetical protein
MRALLRRVLNLSPLFVAGLVVALAARSAGSFLDRPRTLGPSSWQPLADDPVGECGAKDVGRDVRQAFWAVEGGSLYVRLCTAGQPGWQSTPDGWTDARYKWKTPRWAATTFPAAWCRTAEAT